jgi:hypothetical protein
MADNMKHEDRAGARRLGKASMWVSISGVIVTTVIIIAVGAAFGVPVSGTNCDYYVNGQCHYYYR